MRADEDNVKTEVNAILGHELDDWLNISYVGKAYGAHLMLIDCTLVN